MSQFFASSAKTADTIVGGVQALVNALGNQYDANNGLKQTVNPSFSRRAYAVESLAKDERAELANDIEGLFMGLESATKAAKASFPDGYSFNKSQMKAATAAGAIAGDPSGARSRSAVMDEPAGKAHHRFVAALEGLKARPALEAYDEKETKNTVVYSLAYNMMASRQSPEAEMLFPTIVLSPDQFSLTIAIRLVQVYDEVQRAVSGDVNEFGKRNIIRAVIDPTILQNDTTDIVPVYNDDSKKYFVDAAKIAPRDVVLAGTNETITTSAMAINKEYSLLGLSQTDALLRTGFLDSSDAMDSFVILKNIYVDIDGEVFKFQTQNLNSSNFVHAVQGNYRLMNLQFNTKSLMVNKGTKLADDSASTKLASVISGEFEVRLKVSMFGQVNLEFSTTSVNATDVSVFNIVNKDGETLPLNAGQGQTIAALFSTAKVIGYDLIARRTNSNRRQRGQLLDITYEKMEYAVPLLSPITVIRPTAVGDTNDASDLAALISTTHIRTSNAAIAEVLKTVDVLRSVVSQNDTENYNPDLLGVAHFLVNPFFEEHALNVQNTINNLKSFELAQNIQATLVNLLRDISIRMWRNTGYKAASDALAGGIAEKPTILILTDQYLERYLNIFGDTRLLGDTFNVRVEATQNKDMRGKIFMTLGVAQAGTEGTPNPMHFGNMAYKPELSYILPTHRNGANNKETTVAPSYRHFVNLPIGAMITVTGVEETASSKTVITIDGSLETTTPAP